MTDLHWRNGVRVGSWAGCWADLADRGRTLFGRPEDLAGSRVTFEAADSLAALAALALGLRHRLDFAVVPAEETALSSGAGRSRPGRITLLTSGTTGPPKPVPHTLATLTAGRSAPREPLRWYLPYRPGTYAWWQVALRALTGPGQTLIAPAGPDPVAGLLPVLGEVSAISATPTFWRQLLLRGAAECLRRADLRHITLGGEAADQPILDLIADTWPAAEVIHVYAATEAGTAIVVRDRQAGFPASRLAEGRPELEIRAGRLFVRSAGGRSDRSGDWIDTGDRVERVGDRILFRGRAGRDQINVGGVKVSVAAVERHLLGHPSVLWARVGSLGTAIAGDIAVADIVLRPGENAGSVEGPLTAHCATLPDPAQPRVFRFRDDIPMTPALKTC